MGYFSYCNKDLPYIDNEVDLALIPIIAFNEYLMTELGWGNVLNDCLKFNNRLTVKASSGLIHLVDDSEETYRLAIVKLSKYEDEEENNE